MSNPQTCPSCRQHVEPLQRSAARLAPDVVLAHTASTMKGFHPRYVADALGVPESEVRNMCDRMEALGVLERYQRDGETWYRKC